MPHVHSIYVSACHTYVRMPHVCPHATCTATCACVSALHLCYMFVQTPLIICVHRHGSCRSRVPQVVRVRALDRALVRVCNRELLRVLDRVLVVRVLTECLWVCNRVLVKYLLNDRHTDSHMIRSQLRSHAALTLCLTNHKYCIALL